MKSASDSRPFFNPKATNSPVIGTSQMYTSEAAHVTGIHSVKTNGRSTDIREF